MCGCSYDKSAVCWHLPHVDINYILSIVRQSAISANRAAKHLLCADIGCHYAAATYMYSLPTVLGAVRSGCGCFAQGACPGFGALSPISSNSRSCGLTAVSPTPGMCARSACSAALHSAHGKQAIMLCS